MGSQGAHPSYLGRMTALALHPATYSSSDALFLAGARAAGCARPGGMCGATRGAREMRATTGRTRRARRGGTAGGTCEKCEMPRRAPRRWRGGAMGTSRPTATGHEGCARRGRGGAGRGRRARDGVGREGGGDLRRDGDIASYRHAARGARARERGQGRATGWGGKGAATRLFV